MSINVAIRYQSRGGHVKEMAEIISEGIEVEPISIDDPRAPITEPVDLLFIGGALYMFQLDPSMVEYIANIPEGMVRCAIVFGSSALTRRPIYMIQEKLKARGIDINPMAVYMRGKPKPYLREILPPFAAREVRKITKQIEEGTYGEEPEAPIVQMIEAHEEKKAAEKVDAEDAGDAPTTDAPALDAPTEDVPAEDAPAEEAAETPEE